MKTYVIGDIHGGYKSLIQVLERSPFNIQEDKLIFLGDYVDGWSESAQVIQHLIELQEVMRDRVIFIRGNHDKWCQDWLITGQTISGWLVQGGAATVESYIATGYIVDEKHKKFFKSMKNYYIDDQNRGFVHGGFNSRKGLGHEEYESDYYWDRDMLSITMMRHNLNLRRPQGTPSEIRSYKHKEVYVGHTTTINWEVKDNGIVKQSKSLKTGCTEPINVCNVWNLDTGGGYGGKLTIMDIDTKEFWQSDLLNKLYPNEHGR